MYRHSALATEGTVPSVKMPSSSSRTRSTDPGMGVMTDGKPDAMASSSAFGIPSFDEGNAKISAALYHGSISWTKPVQVT